MSQEAPLYMFWGPSYAFDLYEKKRPIKTVNKNVRNISIPVLYEKGTFP